MYVPTYQSLSCLYQKLPVYFVVFLVFMIINITRSVIAFLHTASISPYKYPDHAGCLTNPLPSCIVKHHGWERCLVLQIVDSPEPGVVRPQKVDVVRQHRQVQWNRLQDQSNLC